MSIVYGFFLLILYFFFIFRSYKIAGTLLNPIAFYFANEILRSVIFFIIYPFDDSYFFQYVLIQIEDIDIAFFKYFVFQFVFSVIFYLSFVSGLRSSTKLPIITTMTQKKSKMRIYGNILMIVGIAIAVGYYQNVGGILYYLTHMNERATLSQGTLFFRYYWIVLAAGLSIIITSYKNTKRTIMKGTLLALYTLLTFFMIGIFGGRSPIFFTIIYLLTINFYMFEGNKIRIPKINRKGKLRILYISVVVLAVFFGFVAIREKNAGMILMEEGFSVFANEIVLGSLKKTLQYLNNVNKFLFVFGSDKLGTLETLWYGRSFIDLFFGIIPRSLFINKPPIQEGIYIYSIINGLNVKPSMPASSMYPVAWPIDTIGVWYVNFGIAGILISALLIGKIHAIFYNSVKADPNIFLILIWVYQIFPFSLTNSGIFNFSIIFIFMWFVFTVFAGMKTKLVRYRTQPQPEEQKELH